MFHCMSFKVDVPMNKTWSFWVSSGPDLHVSHPYFTYKYEQLHCKNIVLDSIKSLLIVWKLRYPNVDKKFKYTQSPVL